MQQSTMGQHFLLSAEARTLRTRSINEMDEDKARELFKSIRWSATSGRPVCPKIACKAVDAYEYKSRKIFKCRHCGHQFSVTSGTIFASHKLQFRDLLQILKVFTNAANGISALRLTREIDISYKTAFVIAHKLREAISLDQDDLVLKGVVEADGAYFGGYKQPANYKENRRDMRRAENQTGKRKVAIVVREREGRTVAFVEKNEASAVTNIRKKVHVRATIHVDDATSWDKLGNCFDLLRINHQECYSDGQACTNQAESYFSRLRRAEIGIYHRVSGQHFPLYVRELAAREDMRRIDNGRKFMLILQSCLDHPVSRTFKGYWQRRRHVEVPT